MKTVNTLRTLGRHLAAFTLIELLVVISIIAILASLALPAITGALVKGQIAQTVSNYRQLYVLTQSATLDSQTAGGSGAFPGDVTNSISAWSNALVPAYCSSNTFSSLGYVKGHGANTTVWNVKSTDDPSTIFLSTAGIAGNPPTNITMSVSGPYAAKGGAFVTIAGSAVSLTGTNSPILTNNSAQLSTNGTNQFSGS